VFGFLAVRRNVDVFLNYESIIVSMCPIWAVRDSKKLSMTNLVCRPHGQVWSQLLHINYRNVIKWKHCDKIPRRKLGKADNSLVDKGGSGISKKTDADIQDSWSIKENGDSVDFLPASRRILFQDAVWLWC
jgi:hypothetical protein